MTVTFFGHRDAPRTIQPLLHETLTNLIENSFADNFYVGSNGSFDSMVKSELKNIAAQYEHIKYTVVLAKHPIKNDFVNCEHDTLYPEGIERVHPRFAILFCNEWMVNRSDVVITYVNRNFGGAYKFKEIAKKKGKKVINLAEIK